jgi:hypothetical protein
MKLSKVLCAAAFAATTALVVAGDGASAAGKPAKGSSYTIDPNDPNAEKVCTDLGGTVTLERNGSKTCTLPPGVDVPVQTMREPTN